MLARVGEPAGIGWCRMGSGEREGFWLGLLIKGKKKKSFLTFWAQPVCKLTKQRFPKRREKGHGWIAIKTE